MRLDWVIDVAMVDGDTIDNSCAMIEPHAQYRRAAIEFHHQLRNDAEALHAVKHELLHLTFAPLRRYLEQSLPRRMPGRRIILAHVDDLIETAIEELLRYV